MTAATAAMMAYIDHSYAFLPLAMRSKVKQMAHFTGMAARQNMVCMMNHHCEMSAKQLSRSFILRTNIAVCFSSAVSSLSLFPPPVKAIPSMPMVDTMKSGCET